MRRRKSILVLLSFSLFIIGQAQVARTSKYPFWGINHSNSLPVVHGNKVGKQRIVSQSAVSKIINVPTAGTLINIITPTEKSTITDLVITGKLDASDFRILRDSMVNLTTLDISAVSIASYTGSNGTSYGSTTYPVNEIPEYAFYITGSEPGSYISGLKSIILPLTATSIGGMAFTFCSSLTSITISASVTQIGQVAFVGCGASINVDPANPNYSSDNGVLYDKAKTTLIQCPLSNTGNYTVPSTVNSIAPYSFCFCGNLASVNVPSSVSSIGVFAFTSCSGMINIDSNNPNYKSLDGVFFNKSGSTLIQCPTSKSGSYNIPSSVDSIGNNAFYNCNLMTAVSMPSSISYITDLSFYNCSGLTSITVNSLPVSLGYNVFYNVNTNTCVLNVPFGAKAAYQSASGWSSFTHILENTHGLILGTNKLILSSAAGSNSGVKISTNDGWTAVSDQIWLQVSPESGSGNDTILVTAAANPTSNNRIAIITVSVNGIQPQIVTITQAGLPKTINITAGKLLTSLTTAELSSIINLKITGSIDARDFKTMRDNMPKLAFLDISEATVAAYNGPLGTASWITAYAANRIPDYAFNVGMSSQQFTLAAVKLPSSITAVGDYAFYSCEALTEIVIPNSVTYIGQGGFGSCNSLVNVTLPNNLTTIENSAFMGGAFSSILIPTTLKSIGTYGFGFCKNLKSINIPNSVTTISNSAFESCTSLGDLTIGSTVASIGGSAFNGCISLTSVVIPNSVTLIDSNAFGVCTNLKSVSLPNSLITIGAGCFNQCTNLTDITIPNTVTKIDNSTFSYCKSLSNIVIPNSIITIGYSTFSYCSALSTLTIPNSVTSIGSSAFDGCVGLTSINVNRDVPLNLSASTSVFNNVNKTSCILNVPFGAKNRYAVANQWQDFSNITENIHGFALGTDSVKLLSTEGSKASVSIKSNDSWTITSNQSWLTVSPNSGIGNDTLRFTANVNVSSLKRTATVTVTSGVFSKTITVIQAAAPKIVNITTAGWLVIALTTDELNTITDLTITGTIDARDFKTMRDNMPKLENLDISKVNIVSYSGNNGTVNYYYTYPPNEIPPNAFYNSSTYAGKTKMNTIILPTSVISIGSSAFQYCSGLLNISIPNSVTTIGSSAFIQCSGLSDIKISSSLKSIAIYTFQFCTGLNSIVIPNSVKSIAEYAFQYCSKLTDLVIPDSVNTLGASSFGNCSNLKNVTLSKSLTSINYSVFQNCTSLSNVVFTNSLKIIGDDAFENTGLTNLIIPESVTSIGYYSFASCKWLSEIVLPNTLTSIGSYAFSNCIRLKKITLGNAVTTIKSGTFNNCFSLTNIVIPESVTSIESSAFNYCSSLTNITIPNLVTSIGSEAFRSCTGLTTFSIPASVTRIDWNAFYSCTGLTSIYAFPLKPVDLSSVGMSSNVFYDVDKSTSILYVPSGSKALYQAAVQWKDFTNIIEMTTAVPTLLDSKISIYPNPVKKSFNVTGLNDAARITIMDINGKQVLNKQINVGETEQVGELPKGMYIVRIITADGALEHKLIKE